MWPSESDLESIDSLIDRMNPITGFPYPMKSAVNKGFPKNAGDPWIGRYTKNGYWFKLSWGGNEEWREMANEMWYRNEFLVDSSSFLLYQRLFENNDGKLKLLTAKNIRGEVLGLVLLSESSSYRFSTIGPIFVQEDFRHIGIGSILMEEILKNTDNIVFNAISYLLPTVNKFNLQQRTMRKLGRVRVKNSSGFANLKDKKSGISLNFGSDNTEDQWERIREFGEECTNERRNWKAFSEKSDENCQIVAAFDENTGSCVGISILREIQNEDGHIPDLLIAPLHAKSTAIAEILLQKSLKKHYNPEDDYDFDVDHLAIYRRSVNFFIFSNCESLMFPLLKKLTGNDGSMVKDRIYFQTCSNFQLPAINHDMIFAASDPTVFLC